MCVQDGKDEYGAFFRGRLLRITAAKLDRPAGAAGTSGGQEEEDAEDNEE